MTSRRVALYCFQSQSSTDLRTCEHFSGNGNGDGAEDGPWYLAGGGFTGCFQPLGQLTGAVAGCGAQGAKMLLSVVTDKS